MTEYVVGTFAFRFLSAPGQCRSAALYVVSFVQYKWLFDFGCWSSIITVHVLNCLSTQQTKSFFCFVFFLPFIRCQFESFLPHICSDYN